VCGADLVLFVGSRADGMVTHFWQVPPQGTATVQINLDPRELGRNYPADVAIDADPQTVLRQLCDALASAQPRGAWADTARELVDTWRAELAPLAESDASPIRPERLCREVSQWLPGDAVVVSDTGHSGIWTGTMLDLTHPDQKYMRAAGSLGWAFPASLGARCALPDRPVVCFTGDGGFWYHMSELETALRCGIKTVTVINDNHSLNQDRAGVERAYAGRATGNQEEIWVFRDVDFTEIARSMGCFGVRVERPGELQSALAQALESDLPAVVDVVSDIDVVAPLPYLPG